MADQALEDYFRPFRENVIGTAAFDFPQGRREIVYADWTASAKGYRPIEQFLLQRVLPFFANTHTQATLTGTMMTEAYEQGKKIVKGHVGARDCDALIFCGSGMTAAVNKLQRLMGLKVPEANEGLRPVVFVTSMEHHSNHTSWLETAATVVCIGQNAQGNVDLDHLETLLKKFAGRRKIAAVTACSNVTGIQTPYREIAAIVHRHGGVCLVDFAASAPYANIDMHPADPAEGLDAIYFSMHKFLGGPGTPGVLVFNKTLCRNAVPDHPGGGTVTYTSPWSDRDYVEDLESREDGGTPPVLQGIKAAMCIRLKEAMGIDNLMRREEELVARALGRLSKVPGVTVLQSSATARLGIISFVAESLHYNLMVRLLNDHFGIQSRGGCSCAGMYGHILLNVTKKRSYQIRDSIRAGDLSRKPGWTRISLHPVMTNAAVDFITGAIQTIVENSAAMSKGYVYDAASNDFIFSASCNEYSATAQKWFDPVSWGRGY